MCLASRVFHNIDAKLYNIPRADLVWFRLHTSLAKADVIDEGAITASGVLLNFKLFCVNFSIKFNTYLDEEFAIVVPQYSMISGQYFTVKDGICVGYAISSYRTADLDLL
jgi:hypothetical protein